MTEGSAELTRWTIHGERIIDDTRRARWSIAEVELPDGTRFEQYVLRLPKAAIVVVLDDDNRVLMMWRHRFVIDRWAWELPGGYVDGSEDSAATAAREVEEETGWRPRSIEPLLSFQPMVGAADAENLLFLARGADHVGAPEDINEAERIAWIPLDEVADRITRGEIVGAASVVAVLDVLLRRERGELKALSVAPRCCRFAGVELPNHGNLRVPAESFLQHAQVLDRTRGLKLSHERQCLPADHAGAFVVVLLSVCGG